MSKVYFQMSQKGKKLTAHQSREISILWGRGYSVRTAAAQQGEGHAQSTHTGTHTDTLSWRRSWGAAGALLADSKANGKLGSAS